MRDRDNSYYVIDIHLSYYCVDFNTIYIYIYTYMYRRSFFDARELEGDPNYVILVCCIIVSSMFDRIIIMFTLTCV